MRRDLLGDGDRLDTIEGDDEDGNYGDSDDENDKNGGDRIEVNLDDVVDDDDNESLLGRSSTTGGANSGGNLFTIKESHDRGLADMETGSEVYMSELLVNYCSFLLKFNYRLALIWKTSMKQKNKMRKTS